MNIQNIINNDLFQEESSVWVQNQHKEFDYSEGLESEKYLESVFRNAKDLSNGSQELESYIKDWSSEYHLSSKRAQLFAGFDFDPSLNVLEVGCGCGAITRYLGETFEGVVSIEGSIKRARIAKLRTKDLGGVSIICAPFQEIKFKRQFDIIFCIGVYEYSAAFVSGENPYNSVLRYFKDMLTPSGFVIIAIENQFGLKYFNSSREDHTGKMFEGLEGYPEHRNKVKTFGKYELENTLKEVFSNIKFYYPYPDYKLPDCIIGDDFLAGPRAGELVSQLGSRDYGFEMQHLWDESLVSIELSKNGMLPFFSNSFLVFAGKSEIVGVSFKQLAVMISSGRNYDFRTKTLICADKTDGITVLKKAMSGKNIISFGKLSLVESCSKWRDSFSLQTVLLGNCALKDAKLEDIFRPCREWIDFLKGKSEYYDEERYLAGDYVDCIWCNFFHDPDGGSIIDKEWVWNEKIRMNTIIIRSIFNFLYKIKNKKNLPMTLRLRNKKKLISIIAETLEIGLTNKDFIDFVKIESEFQSLVKDTGKKRNAIILRWLLFDSSSYYFLSKLKNSLNRFNLRLLSFIGKLLTQIRVIPK